MMFDDLATVDTTHSVEVGWHDTLGVDGWVTPDDGKPYRAVSGGYWFCIKDHKGEILDHGGVAEPLVSLYDLVTATAGWIIWNIERDKLAMLRDAPWKERLSNDDETPAANLLRDVLDQIAS